jgi:hypothetical protein
MDEVERVQTLLAELGLAEIIDRYRALGAQLDSIDVNIAANADEERTGLAHDVVQTLVGAAGLDDASAVSARDTVAMTAAEATSKGCPVCGSKAWRWLGSRAASCSAGCGYVWRIRA